MHLYEVRPRKDRRGVDLISDALPFGALWYAEANATTNAIGYANFYSRSHATVIRVYDAAGNVIKTHDTRASSKSHERAWRPAALRSDCPRACHDTQPWLMSSSSGCRST
jgi:hypothetical protein